MNTILEHRAAIAIAAAVVVVLGFLSLALYRKDTGPITPAPIVVESPPVQYQYVEVINGCDSAFTGTCVNLRSGPGETYPVVSKLRIGVVLKVATSTITNGHEWYKVRFDEGVRYPERVTGDWYVSAEVVHMFYDDGDRDLVDGENASSTKRIIVDRSEQILYAYEGDALFLKEKISTGLELTPTPRGTFTVFRKTPSRYMQGPLPGISDQYYDLPGVPWDLYFTPEGGAIHGAYWHDKFGQQWSHGCVNLPLQTARELYQWADIGTTVIVRD